MANSSKAFLKYNSVIKLSDEKRQILLQVRKSLRNRMKSNYLIIPMTERKNFELEFQSQGSFVMDTIITPVNCDFDLDDGVYFQGGLSSEQRPDPQIFHNWVIFAIGDDNDYEKVEDRSTCVRVNYKEGFHVDIPIYYADNYDSPDLAHTKDGWILSNPVEFIAWFEDKAQSGFKKEFINESLKYAEPYEKWLTDVRKKDSQLRRLVRYLKAWADLKKSEMPCGIIMTILVANNFAVNERDDIALRDTLVNIQNYLTVNDYKCPRPTSPVDEDLFASTSETKKKYFWSALNSLITSANKAIDMDDDDDACNEWKKHFGDRFSCLSENNNINHQPNLDALKRTASVSQPWFPKK